MLFLCIYLNTQLKQFFQSYYKQPRLRKGTVPSQFPWTEITVDDAPIHKQTQMVSETVQQCEEENTQEIINEIKFSFIDLVACTTLQLPVNWTRRTLICEETKIESFITVQCIKIENSFITKIIKELIIQENLCLKINVMCKPFNATSLGICTDAISSIEEAETTLNVLNARKICSGAFVAKNVMYSSSVAYIDNIGTVRHNKCLILLKSNVQCTFCKRLEGTLKKAELRIKKQRQRKRIKRIHLALSPRKHEKLSRLRQKHYVALKAKRRVQQNATKLKIYLEKCQKAMTKMNSQLINELLTKQNIPKHQRIAITEILSTANSKNKHGRRYSEEWMLMCMLMHMQSPKSYNFLRKNEILPLPCVRTIRR